MRGASPARSGIERLSGGDLMQWQADVGPVPQHIGALLLFGDDAPAARQLAALLVPRLTEVAVTARRPVRPPFGAGSWYWLDDDTDRGPHLAVRSLPPDATPASGPLGTSLAAATDEVMRRFDGAHSPWRCTVLARQDGSAAGLVVTLHHVLADGVSALTVLTALADAGPANGERGDGRPRSPAAGTPRPRYRELVTDAWQRRVRAVRAAGGLVRGLRDARAELGGGNRRAPRTALNVPAGPRRTVHLAELDEREVRAAAHAHGASVNDLVLVAVAHAFGAAAADVGDRLDEVLISVPVAAQRFTPGERSPGRPGNAVGVMPVPVPVTGPVEERIRRVTSIRHERLAGPHGRSLPLVLAAFRVVHALRSVRLYLRRQRLVNTFVTAVPPIPVPVRIADASVQSVVALVSGQGNQTVACATTRYRGRLNVAVMVDPEYGPDGDRFVRRLTDVLSVAARGGDP